MLPCNFFRFGLKFFRFSQRRCYFFVAISLIFFILNVLIIFNYLDLQSSLAKQGFEAENYRNQRNTCELKDDLAKSAFKRMKTQECRDGLTKFYCSIGNLGFPVQTIENRCHSFGVEYTYECFCGEAQELKIERKLIDESLCHKYICPGDNSSFCGGFNAVSVYSTGILEKKKPIPEYSPLSDNSKTANVKILFLFQLNGRNIRQLKRVLRMLYSPKHLFYFHVDSRQDFLYYEIEKLVKSLRLKGITNLYLSQKRYVTIWGGTSLLEMFLDVIQTTFKMKEFADWDYILNMSETDMPLLSVEELEHNIAKHMGKSFLSSHGYNTGNFIRKQGFNFYFFECENHMWRIKNRNNFPNDLRIDGGSDWVIIHRDLAKFAISENDEYVENMRRFFSSILLPLEGFFHTLALNSKFCDHVLYKNLRLTNWKRKQGCRCAMLKEVVDWCGCSPVVLKIKEDDIGLEKAKSKALFFGRKFESIIDIDAIAQAERQVLRFKPALMISSSPVFNSTWLNFYDKSVDSTNPKCFLYDHWAKILFDEWASGQSSKIVECPLESLLEIFAYKEFSSALIQLILVIKDRCGNEFELLVERKQIVRIFENARIDDYRLISMEFGVNLDLKEEIYRDFTGLTDSSGTATVLWHWHCNDTALVQKTNTTSPTVNIRWFNPQGKIFRNDPIKPYDSINYAQYATLNFEDLLIFKGDVSPGIWKAVLFFEDPLAPLAEISFPIFPDDLSENLSNFEEEGSNTPLVKRFYKLVDVCSRSFIQSHVHVCESSVLWSTVYPDPKSDFDGSSILLV